MVIKCTADVDLQVVMILGLHLLFSLTTYNARLNIWRFSKWYTLDNILVDVPHSFTQR